MAMSLMIVLTFVPFSGSGPNKKRQSSQDLSEKAKRKRAKLDPLQLKTVTEIQAKLMQHDNPEQGRSVNICVKQNSLDDVCIVKHKFVLAWF